MEPIAKSELFFFVSTIALVVFVSILVMALYFVIKILRDIKFIAGKAKEEAANISEDIQNLRQNVKNEGVKVKHIARFFNSFYNRRQKKN